MYQNIESGSHCETRCVISRVFVICQRPKCGRQKWLNNCQFHVIWQQCLKLWFEIENSFSWLDLYTILKNRATSRIVYRIKLYSITLVKYVFHTHIFNTLKMMLIWPVATVWCVNDAERAKSKQNDHRQDVYRLHILHGSSHRLSNQITNYKTRNIPSIPWDSSWWGHWAE